MFVAALGDKETCSRPPRLTETGRQSDIVSVLSLSLSGTIAAINLRKCYIYIQEEQEKYILEMQLLMYCRSCRGLGFYVPLRYGD